MVLGPEWKSRKGRTRGQEGVDSREEVLREVEGEVEGHVICVVDSGKYEVDYVSDAHDKAGECRRTRRTHRRRILSS
jgi:hypothetical protein